MTGLGVVAIIPTYNRARLLGETIAAVLAQTEPPEEVLVAIDGSTDDSQAVAASFGSQISILAKPNSGKAATLNEGLRRTSQPLVWIVDDDDLPRRDGLASLRTLLADAPQAGFAFGRHERFEVDQETGAWRRFDTGYWGDDASDRFLISTLEDFFVHQPAMLVQRALYDAAGPFDEALNASEDYEMLVRLARLARPASTTRVIFDQRIHAGARGRGDARYAANDRNAAWLEADQAIFSRLRTTLPLAAYLPAGRALDPASRRTALLQRAVVFIRRKMWSEAFEDLHAAIDCGVDAPLSNEERDVLGRALLSKYGCLEVLKEPGVTAGLQALKRRSPLGRAAVRAIAGRLTWRAREAAQAGRLEAAAGFARTFLRLRV